MPSEKPIRRLQDIIENAEAILRYTAGMSLSDFQSDRKTYDVCQHAAKTL